MRQWIDKLREERTLRPEEFRQLLTECDGESLRYINKQAQEVSLRHFGNRIFIRGLIEVSNCCRNNCYYCGIRKGNPNLERYRLSTENILNCCKQGYGLGFRTFVLQGGEDPALTEERIEDIVSTIRRSYPDCAITLSLGEKSREAYERFFQAGANRYLLRHETYDKEHYQQLHPAGMSCEHRLQCLRDLKDIGYQTGTGIMVGQSGTDDRTPDSGYSVYRTASPRNDWYRPLPVSSRHTFCPVPQRNRGTDAPFIIHLPSDASVGADSGNYGTGYPHSRRPGTGNTGRRQCCHAQFVATGRTQKVQSV